MNPPWWNLKVSEDGEALNIGVHGVIDGGLFDDAAVSTAEIAKQLQEHKNAKAIDVHINSMGGSLAGGLAIYNLLSNHPAEVRTYVDGVAASAASIIAMAGRTTMGRGAMMMVHSPWTIVQGNAADLRRAAAVLDKGRESLVAVYKDKTGKDGAALRAMLDAETWMTAEQAQRNGFADEIAGGEDPSVEAKGEEVIFNSIAFPRERMPAQVLAMAGVEPGARGGAAPPPDDDPGTEPRSEGGNHTDDQSKLNKLLGEILNRELLDKHAPDLLAALLEEGRASITASVDDIALAKSKTDGAAAERARLQAIDDLQLHAEFPDLVYAAKYGETPQTDQELAVAVIRARGSAGSDFLARRAAESQAAAGVQTSPPDNARTAEQIGREIAGYINARRGGK